MSEPYVSPYEDLFLEAFGRGIERLPSEYPELVKSVIKKINAEIIDTIQNDIYDYMAERAHHRLRDTAAAMTESMLMNALAGDDKTIKNLFGFKKYYMQHAYLGTGATQWKLIDAIVARRPDIFLDERLKQKDAEITELNRTISGLKRDLEYWKNIENTPF